MTDAALRRRLEKLQSILEVAKALAAERHLDRLLTLMVDAAATVAEADRCTLFIADRDKGELWSKVAHGTREIRVPLGAGIAGAVAATGTALRVDDAYADARFNEKVDHETGYRTRSILAVPMRNTRGDVVGVLEALNRRDGPFTAEDEELLGALAGPAASAIENAVLNDEIERLFEGFVQASVLAIEQRDPTTPSAAIAVETRMMTIADIFDALTASDRPYKKAMPAEKAIDILRDEARRGQLDGALLGVFVEAGVWRESARG